MQSPGIALVRRPTEDMAAGIVTHVERVPVDAALAAEQHAGYRAALAAAGWDVREVDPAPGCPDATFVEDTVVVVDGTAVLTRSGAASRRAEVPGTEQVVRDLGLDVVRITGDGTLDGGDVLQVDDTVYVGRGGRTNADGIRQLRGHLTPLGRTVVPVRLQAVLHLKSAVTALPDGTFLTLPDLLEPGAFPSARPVSEEPGCHVVPLGGDQVLISSAAPRTADRLADLGFTPRVVDIGEFEKLEGCVTCLSVLIRRPAPAT
ncbi:dimethylargininase [Blastococcus capsensis]|uniref:dimethylargininase n=1 Tax=Blastococcus capsensis TaxID=1564163 RepID=UPI0025424FF4|nr:dimethylargininase [Blastococcus capsensis]MDK3255578.1 N(G),N(G)-dimethylarginine dimethylaminohydrolase [Blastococcus capsensis]